MFKFTSLTLVTALMISGCAAMVETPRSKIFDRVDPISIKDMDKYGRDVDTCEKIVNEHQRKRNQKELGSIIAGAIVGAAFGAIVTPHGYGIRSEMIQAGALAGGTTGLAHSANRTLSEQDRIIANCMINRGYKILY
jgi:uncharacterized protein YcfJ